MIDLKPTPIVIEYDGPYHYINRTKEMLASDHIISQLLTKNGVYKLIWIPYYLFIPDQEKYDLKDITAGMRAYVPKLKQQIKELAGKN